MPLLLLLGFDPAIRPGLEAQLKAEGFEVRSGGRSTDAASLIREAERGTRPDAILLGGEFPEGNALGVLGEIRRSEVHRSLPVLMVTSSSDEIDRALAVDPGADDFLPSPFGFREAAARLRALLRRAAFMDRQPRGRLLRHHGMELDLDRQETVCSGVPVELTRREFELLAYFLENPGRVLPRERILRDVWGLEYLGESRTIDAHVRRLRSKLGGEAAAIETIVGVGYRFAGRA